MKMPLKRIEAANFTVFDDISIDFCKEQYYVYGCEPDCKYRKECNVHNKFKNFERKNKNG